MNKQPKTSSIANITLECREMRPEIPNFVSQKGGCNKEVEEGANLMNEFNLVAHLVPQYVPDRRAFRGQKRHK